MRSVPLSGWLTATVIFESKVHGDGTMKAQITALQSHNTSSSPTHGNPELYTLLLLLLLVLLAAAAWLRKRGLPLPSSRCSGPSCRQVAVGEE